MIVVEHIISDCVFVFIMIDHCFDHNKGCIRPHSYCLYRRWS